MASRDQAAATDPKLLKGLAPLRETDDITPVPSAARIYRSERYCEECGCDHYEIAQPSPGYFRKECAECGSTGPFMAENPHYGPGNPDWQRDRFRERFVRP